MKSAAVALLAAVFALPSYSQIREGKNTEFSISGSFQNISSARSSNSSSALLLSPRLGFFVAGGLEIEPEVVVMLGDGYLSYVLDANVAYNFPVESKGVPFLLAGYGYANTVPVFGVPFTSTDYALGVLNLGSGLKIFFADNIALRLEYRFQNYTGSGEATVGDFSSSRETDITLHIVQFGFSVLL